MNFNDDEIKRYERHFLIPEIGEAGQQKLHNASVIIVGIGGLGSVSSLYLTAAGIGKIGIVDCDTVNISNLQRQILYSTQDVGLSKTQIAYKKLQSLNPNSKIIPIKEKYTELTAHSITKDFSYVVDGSDNFETRFLINDICSNAKIPYIYGAIYQFYGQISVFDANQGPCFCCLFPHLPSNENKEANREIGVVGPVPAQIGSLQALEVIKLILGIGNPLIGRLLLFNGLDMTFKEIVVKKNKSCPVCG